MTLKAIPLIFLLALFFFCVACSEDPACNQELPYDSLSIGFYDDETFEKVSIKYELILARGSDSILYDSEDSIQVFNFPMNPSAFEVTFRFVTGVRIDSIVLSYDKQLEWLSEECGPNFRYSGLSIVDHSFDSARLINSEFDLEIDENIRVYN
ncbi:MAG: hypothetical protein JXR07_02790 [Reichenbachiella sp.]